MTADSAAAAGARPRPGRPAAATAPSTAPWPSSRTAYWTVFLLILSLTLLQLDTNIVPYFAAKI